MKTIFTIIISAVCFSASAQKTSGGSLARYNWQSASIELSGMIIPVHGDTLLLKDTSIHFIAIGDQVFEIKRSIELKPATEPPVKMRGPDGEWHPVPFGIDTLHLRPNTFVFNPFTVPAVNK